MNLKKKLLKARHLVLLWLAALFSTICIFVRPGSCFMIEEISQIKIRIYVDVLIVPLGEFHRQIKYFPHQNRLNHFP